MESILILGASGHAKVIIDIVERAGRYRVEGLLDDSPDQPPMHYGYPRLGTIETVAAQAARDGVRLAIVAVGDNWTRNLLVRRLHKAAPDFGFATAVHPEARLARGATVGEGSVVMAGAVVNADARIGRHCIVNTAAALDHDGVMEDYSSLAPGAVVGGNAVIGQYAAVCIGATVSHAVRLGEHSVLGACALALRDVPASELWHGIPAKRISARAPDEPYL